MPIPRKFFEGPSVVNTRGHTLNTSISEMPLKDGTTLVLIEQAPLHREPDDPDTVALDDDAQEHLYIHLSKKFAATGSTGERSTAKSPLFAAPYGTEAR